METRSLPFWKKFLYGFGNLGNCFIWVVISSYILIYCTNVVGIGAGIIGTLLMSAKLLDGITDVFMGRIIDLTKSKLGKARFWYLISCAPLGICMYLIFSVPAHFSDTAKYMYIFIIYLLISAVFYTMNSVAYNTLVALTTKNSKDQVTMSSISMLFGMAGAVVIASFTPGFVEKLGGGQTGWQTIAVIYAIVGVVILLIPGLVLKELPEEEKATGEAAFEKVTFKETILDLVKNKYFIIILLMYLFGNMNSGVNSTIGIYYATYVLNDPSLLGVLGLAGTVAMIIGIPFMPKVIEKTGMRKACVCGMIISAVGCLLAFAGQFAGLAVMLVGLFVKGLGIVPGSAAYSPFMALTAEYNYKKTGHKITGSIFSCASVGTKVGTELGTALCGWMLEWAKFDGAAAVQSTLANHTIIGLYMILPLIITIINVFLYVGMDVENKLQ